MSGGRERESWTDWVKHQREDSESTTGQLTAAGVSFETALIITMLAKIHEEVATQADAIRDDDEEWRDGT